jgi:hypothetical protein
MNRTRKFIAEVTDKLATDPQFVAEFKANPQKALNEVEKTVRAEIPDTWIYRIVVLALGITVVSIVIGVLIVMATGNYSGETSIPTILTAIGSAAIGALAGLLAPSPAP